MRSSEPRSHRPHRGVMVTFQASIELGPVEAALPGWRARPPGAAGAGAYPRRHGGLRFGLSFALGTAGAGVRNSLAARERSEASGTAAESVRVGENPAYRAVTRSAACGRAGWSNRVLRRLPGIGPRCCTDR
jgi:hypothetical protein